MEYAVLTFRQFWYMGNLPDLSQVDFPTQKQKKYF